MRHWISVSDKLPEIDIVVWVWPKFGGIAELGKLHRDTWRCQQYDGYEYYTKNDIMFWMPLPRSPNEVPLEWVASSGKLPESQPVLAWSVLDDDFVLATIHGLNNWKCQPLWEFDYITQKGVSHWMELPSGPTPDNITVTVQVEYENKTAQP